MDLTRHYYDLGSTAALEKYAVMMRGNPSAPMAPKPPMPGPAPGAAAVPAAGGAPGAKPGGMMGHLQNAAGHVNSFMGTPLGSAVGQGVAMAGIPMIADKLLGGGQPAAPQGF